MKDQNILTNNGVDLQTSLELFGDIDMYNESLGDFMVEIGSKLDKIKTFKSNNDMENYAIIVHSIKSDAKYFGFTELAEMALQHEAQSKAKNAHYVGENFDALMAEVDKVLGIVNQYLGTSDKEVAPTPEVEHIPLTPEAPLESTDAPKTILVVDDSDIIKNFILKKFENTYTIITAAEGAEAIKQMKRKLNIGFFLLDLNKPNCKGFEVLDYMRSQDLFKHIPVSVITGNDNKEIDDKAFEYPIVDILKKPFSEGLIQNIIEKTINSKNY